MITQATIAIISILVMAAAAIPQAAIAGSGGSRFFDESLDDLQGNSARSRYYYKKREKKSRKGRKRTRRIKKRSTTPQVSAEGVRVQKALQMTGFYHGPLDGKLDSYDSRVAAMQYQQKYGLPQTGELTSDLMGVLLQQTDIAELSGHLINTGVTQQDKGKRLQAALKVQGYYTAMIDGDFGPKSLAAMRLYQQTKGLTPSGALLPEQEQELVAVSIQLLESQQSQTNQVLEQLALHQPSQQVTPVQTPPEQVSDQKMTTEINAGQQPLPQQHQPDIQQVLFAKQALNQKGYQVGTSDGVYDSEIRNAVINFQKDTGIEQSGELDTETLEALGVSDSMGAELDAQVNSGKQSELISEKTQVSPVIGVFVLTEMTELKAEEDVFSEILAELPAGKEIIINSIEGDWAHVSVDDQQGYVYAEFLQRHNK